MEITQRQEYHRWELKHLKIQGVSKKKNILNIHEEIIIFS